MDRSSPDREELLDVDQELSAEQMYRETMCGVRSFMGWTQVPEFDCIFITGQQPFWWSEHNTPAKYQ